MENNWSGASAGPNMKKEMELAWTYVKKKWWQHHPTGATVDTTRPQRKRATSDLEKEMWTTGQKYSWRSEEGGGGSTRQSWVESSGMWPMFHQERKA